MAMAVSELPLVANSLSLRYPPWVKNCRTMAMAVAVSELPLVANSLILRYSPWVNNYRTMHGHGRLRTAVGSELSHLTYLPWVKL